MSRTLFFRDIAGSVARTEASRRAHVGDGPRVVHGGRRSTRYAWPGRRCQESRRGVGETTGSARDAGNVAALQAGQARPRVSDRSEQIAVLAMLAMVTFNAGSSKVKPARAGRRGGCSRGSAAAVEAEHKTSVNAPAERRMR